MTLDHHPPTHTDSLSAISQLLLTRFQPTLKLGSWDEQQNNKNNNNNNNNNHNTYNNTNNNNINNISSINDLILT